jgi:cell division protease FtsH
MSVKPPEKPAPNIVGSATCFGLVCLAATLFWGLIETGRIVTPEPVPYSRFETLLDGGKIKSVVVAGNILTGETSEPLPSGTSAFTTERVPLDLAEQLSRHSIAFSSRPTSNWPETRFAWLIPPLLFFGVWFLFRRMGGNRSGLGGGLLSVGKSRAKLFVETAVKVNFDDVAGIDEAKAELREIVDFLKEPEAFGRLGAHLARGILLVGPPGTGKTLLARAVAGEAGVPFYSTNGSEFVEMFVGIGAARVRDLFDQARKSAPCIIFIDELDALGRARGPSPMGGIDEKEQTLNQLLAEMDGFDRSVAVVILAATNRPEILDPALLRPGRFDRQIPVDRPDRAGRLAILDIHTASLKTDPRLDCTRIAALTPGFTGADLANLANEAAIVATRRGAEMITAADFVAAIERIVGGLEKRSCILGPRERRIVATHEMGHALVAHALPGTDPVQKISIIPHGIGALGYTLQRPTEDRFLMGRQELVDRMTVLFGGRAAETLMFADVSTGASDDLAKATDLARGMVQRYGMDEALGPVAYDTDSGTLLDQPGNFWRPRRCAPETAREIDQAVRRLLGDALERAIGILRRNRAQLEAGADLLLQHETLDADQLPVVAVEKAA